MSKDFVRNYTMMLDEIIVFFQKRTLFLIGLMPIKGEVCVEVLVFLAKLKEG